MGFFDLVEVWSAEDFSWEPWMMGLQVLVAVVVLRAELSTRWLCLMAQVVDLDCLI